MMSESGSGGCLKGQKNTRKGTGSVRWQHPEIPLTIMEEKSLSSKHKESSSLTFEKMFNDMDGLLAKMSLEIKLSIVFPFKKRTVKIKKIY